MKRVSYWIPLFFGIIFVLIFVSLSIYYFYFSLAPHYPLAFMFLIPACIFIAYAIYIKICHIDSYNFDYYLIAFVCFFISFFFFFCIVNLLDSTVQIHDIEKYEKVLKYSQKRDKTLVTYFPQKIPTNAENPQFYYVSSFLDGSKTIALQYHVNSETELNQYINHFSSIAQWIGSPNSDDSKQFGVPSGSSIQFDSPTNMPKDVLVYVLKWQSGNNRRYEIRNYIFISKDEKEILFYADKSNGSFQN